MLPKKIILFILAAFFCPGVKAQSIANGNFSGGTASWGCAAETNPESTYGGATSNPVAEVDAAAGLCQTLTGLTIGSAYLVSFQASRRTGGCPSPAVTNVVFSVSGGVLSTVITRTNTTFALTTSSYLFTANATSHTIDFTPGAGFGGSTCGMIMDNVSVAFSPLPIELIYFNGIYKNNSIQFEWETATEKNSALFEIEKSKDGVNYQKILSYPSKATGGNSSTKLEYKTSYDISTEGLNYYRLKQIDYDQKISYSPVVAISSPGNSTPVLYPNPNSGDFTLKTSLKGLVNVELINPLGEVVFFRSQILNSDSDSDIQIKAGGIAKAGVYQCRLSAGDYIKAFRVMIQ